MIGRRIHELRRRYGLSQVQFASRLDISQGYLSELEHGAKVPGFPILASLKQYFPEIDANWLLTGKGSMLLRDFEPEATTSPSETTFAEMQAKIDALSAIIVKACAGSSMQTSKGDTAEVLRIRGLSPAKLEQLQEYPHENS